MAGWSVHTPLRYSSQTGGEVVFNKKLKMKLIAAQYRIKELEERLCIRYHMGAYETSDWDEYDQAIRKFPNVLWTHTADMLASKLMEE